MGTHTEARMDTEAPRTTDRAILEAATTLTARLRAITVAATHIAPATTAATIRTALAMAAATHTARLRAITAAATHIARATAATRIAPTVVVLIRMAYRACTAATTTRTRPALMVLNFRL